MPQEPDYVTIQIPGIQDIIRIPVLDTPEYKQQRILRMKSAVSPLPDAVKWIPDWINFLDDAQDLIITALALGKLFIPKLLGRALPLVGTVLTASNALNLVNSFLGAATGTGFAKRDILETMKRFKLDRASRIAAGSSFLSKRLNWVPFVLQAGQVLYNATGWGLQLGTIFGAISDTVYATFKAAQGKQVRIIPPPSEDIYDKAFRYMTQSWIWPYIAPGLTYDELKQGQAGLYASLALIFEAGRPTIPQDRLDEYAKMKYPGYAVTNPSSVEALKAEGFTDDDLVMSPQYYEQFASSMDQACQSSIAWDPNLTNTLAEKSDLSVEATAVQQATGEAAAQVWDIYSEQPNALEWMHSPYERLLSRMWHENVFPPWYLEPCERTADSFTTLIYPGNDMFMNPLNRTCRNIAYTFYVVNPSSGIGGYVIADPWRLPRWFPPEYPDHAYQLIWFLEIALSLKCGKIDTFPNVGPAQGKNVTIIEGKLSPVVTRAIPLRIASVLVWGNAWSKPLNPTDPTLPPQVRFPFCIIDKPTGWPKLGGIAKETDELVSIRGLMPRPGQLPNRIEADTRGVGAVVWDGGVAPDPTTPW